MQAHGCLQHINAQATAATTVDPITVSAIFALQLRAAMNVAHTAHHLLLVIGTGRDAIVDNFVRAEAENGDATAIADGPGPFPTAISARGK